MKKIINRVKVALKYLFTGEIEPNEYNISDFIEEQEITFKALESFLEMIDNGQKMFIENSKYDIDKIDKSFDVNCLVLENTTLKKYLIDCNAETELLTKEMGMSISDINEINEMLLTDSNKFLLTPTQRIIIKKLHKFIELGAYSFAVMQQKQELYLNLAELRREEL